MNQFYTTSDNTMQEEILSQEINLKSWGDAAILVREKIKRLSHVADAFERYDKEGEPFIGESLKKGATI
ncbi:MAG TPA: hypothetical protein DC054_19395 [Blastocatellia bacterium]|nr:hypothetical protein [Blastocatellia bacterium]